MSLDFFNNLKESLEKNDTLSKITDGISDFIGELSEALQKNEKLATDTDIVTQIASSNKLTIASENSIIQTRNEVLSEYANNTKEEGPFYFVCNKVKGKESYRVWAFSYTHLDVYKRQLLEKSDIKWQKNLKKRDKT